MNKIRILSGGAAQGLVTALAPKFEAEIGYAIDGDFGAVGGMVAKLRAGAAADLVILTSTLIAELTGEGHLATGSAADLGTVHTGVAVRIADKVGPIDDKAALRERLLEAEAIYVPDPQQATAGIHFAKVLRELGIWDQVEPRLRTFPNGATAMRELAAATSHGPLGCTQVTEILNTSGVRLVGVLPEGCGLATVYTGALGASASHPDPARRLLALLTSDASRELRQRAGFA